MFCFYRIVRSCIVVDEQLLGDIGRGAETGRGGGGTYAGMCRCSLKEKGAGEGGPILRYSDFR